MAAIISQCYLQLLLPDYMGQITRLVTSVGYTPDVYEILSIGGIMITISAGVFILAIIQNFLGSTLSAFVGRELRNEVFQKVNTISLAEYNKFGTATLITRTTNDIEQIKNFILIAVRTLIMSPTMMVIALIHTIQTNASLTIVIACALPLIIVIMGIIFRLASPMFKLLQTKLDNLTIVLRENLTGIRVVRAYNQQETEYKKFDFANYEMTSTIKKVGRIMSIANPSINIIFNVAYITIYMIGIILIDGQFISESSFTILSDVAVCANYTTQVMMSFLMFAMVFIMWPQASACSKRVNEILDVETSINDEEARKYALNIIDKEFRDYFHTFRKEYKSKLGHDLNEKTALLDLKNKKFPVDSEEYNFLLKYKELSDKYNNVVNKINDHESEEYVEIINKLFSQRKIHGELEFDNVSFVYPDADKPTIKNVSFKAAKGTTTAIIGSTGSGKSTIVNLIPRFYDVTNGTIRFDGIDIKKLPQKVLRDNLGFVPQQAVLFYGTIKDNLKFGKKDATDDEINQALSIAQAQHFISKLPEGLDTFVSQSGKNFSGGQKQRLSIARALVKQPEVYVFDDSFSALDFKTDVALRTALKKYTKNSAVIIVAQRVSSIIDADNILVINDGEVVGQGKHSDLLLNCPVYQDIVKSQLDPEEVEKTIQMNKEENLRQGGNL